MQQEFINPTGNAYSQALELSEFKRLLFISGQVPESKEETCPPNFTGQCRLVWKNIGVQLHAAGLGFGNLVKVTVFLSDRQYREENKNIRIETLGGHEPALTIIITGIYDEKWLLEIEAIAAE